jgi:hypothetical protein
VGGDVIDMGRIGRSTREMLLFAVIGYALLIGSRTVNAQFGGALQYPPASGGEDAQPPPPARMAPQSISPRRIDLEVSGPSQRPDHAIRDVHPRRIPTPLPTASGR